MYRCRRLLQCLQVKCVVLFVDEYGLSVDAACHDVLWNIGYEVSELAQLTQNYFSSGPV